MKRKNRQKMLVSVLALVMALLMLLPIVANIFIH